MLASAPFAVPADFGAADVAVSVCTCRRSHGLKRLLRGIHRQRTTRHRGTTVGVLVVNNDSSGLSPRFREAVRSRLRYPVHWVHAPAGSILHCRNVSLRHVPQDAQFVALVDDDEVPARTWLHKLLEAERETGARIVGGPTMRRLPPDAPRWVASGTFFESAGRGKRPDGPPVSEGNLLLSTDLLSEFDLWFDESLGACGGHDTDFLARMNQQGHPAAWAEEAVVYEPVEEKRLSAGWILQRALRTGTTVGHTLSRYETSSLRRALLVLYSLGRVELGVVGTLPMGLARGYGGLVRSLEIAAGGLGHLFGAAGYCWREYAPEGGFKKVESQPGAPRQRGEEPPAEEPIRP